MNKLETDEKQRIVELLLECPSVQDEGSRNALLKQLPRKIASAVNADSNPKVHVLNIVDTCISYPGGLEALLDTLRFFDDKTVQYQCLTEFVGKIEKENPDASTNEVRTGEIFSAALLLKLNRAIEQAKLDDKRLNWAYQTSLNELMLLEQDIPELRGEALFISLLEALLALPLKDDKHPALDFLSRLVPYAKKNNLLRQWIEKAASELKLPASEKGRLRSLWGISTQQDELNFYVLISLQQERPQSAKYILRAWYVDFCGEPRPIEGWKDTVTELDNEMPHLLRDILNNVRKAVPNAQKYMPWILEFFLPLDLLNRDLDKWTSSGDIPISVSYPLAVRAAERLDGDWIAGWMTYWQPECLCEPADTRRVEWFERPGGKLCYADVLEQGKICLKTKFSPDTNCLQTMLQEGAGIILWPRSRLDQKIITQLQSNFKRVKLQDIPKSLQKIRRNLYKNNRSPGFFSLLWDDPNRVPYTADQESILTSPEDNF
ncbi:MAG: hypothetical protein GY862_35570 [Gammaproteobacteria bacterium]|nr:hypothetical protein [Gammaproteobacteria bacterium]